MKMKNLIDYNKNKFQVIRFLSLSSSHVLFWYIAFEIETFVSINMISLIFNFLSNQKLILF